MDDPSARTDRQRVDQEALAQGEVDDAPLSSAEKVVRREQIRLEADEDLAVGTQDRPDHPPS